MIDTHRGSRLVASWLAVAGCAVGEYDELDDDVAESDRAGDGDFEGKKLDDAEVAAAVAALGLDADHRCGDSMVQFRPGPDAVKTPVFTGKNLPWHKWRPCLANLRDKVSAGAPALLYDTIYNQVLYVLSHERVEFRVHGKDGRKRLANVIDDSGALKISKFDRLVETNDDGLAYSAMDQVDLGLGLLRMHRKTTEHGPPADPRSLAYLTLGLAALDILVDEVDEGGLRTKKACEKDPALTCSWLHGKTSKSGDAITDGGTLNKHLYAVRDLYRSGEVLQEVAPSPGPLHDRADKYRKVALQGMHQMVHSASAEHDGDTPNLRDYIPVHDGVPIQDSWLYYGRNITDGKPYFLDSGYKNCGYHLLVIGLLHTNLGFMQAEGLDIGGFTKRRNKLEASVLEFILDSYTLKLAKGGLFADSPSHGDGHFEGCDPELHTEIDPQVIDDLYALHD
jgi:hypothetical protein